MGRKSVNSDASDNDYVPDTIKAPNEDKPVEADDSFEMIEETFQEEKEEEFSDLIKEEGLLDLRGLRSITDSSNAISKYINQQSDVDLSQTVDKEVGDILKSNKYKLIDYEGRKVVYHNNIYQIFNDDKMKQIALNQTYLENNDKAQTLTTKESILEFLKFSQNFNTVTEIKELSQGGESIVYDMQVDGLDECVIKVPLPRNQNHNGYQKLMIETQLIKSIANPKYVIEVKEELVELNAQTLQI